MSPVARTWRLVCLLTPRLRRKANLVVQLWGIAGDGLKEC
jgi:hypothetical protein